MTGETEESKLTWPGWAVLNLLRMTATFAAVTLVWAVALQLSSETSVGLFEGFMGGVVFLGPYWLPGAIAYIIALGFLVRALPTRSARVMAFITSPILVAFLLAWLPDANPVLIGIGYFGSICASCAIAVTLDPLPPTS